jgi:hypothetical protein
MSIDPDAVHRTAKILLDADEEDSIAAAEAELGRYVLQIDVGPGISGNASRQALVLTAVNAGARAFLGGVRVRLAEDSVVEIGWDVGRPLSEAVQRHGGVIVTTLTEDAPTVCVGEATPGVRGGPLLRATFDGWSAGVVEGAQSVLAERSWFVPAGVAAGGIAVAEAFQARRGDPRAGRRRQGISLWRPELDWEGADAVGPQDCSIAPSRLWLIGLGHLGQGYLWSLGLLPYADPEEVTLLLQDDDRITEANQSTGLLTPTGWGRRRKVRALAEILEHRGFTTALSERRFQPGQGPLGDEPTLALVGVDNPETRRYLSDAGFEAVIDAGLGAGPAHYLDLQTHTFPADRRSDQIPAWRDRRLATGAHLMALPAYQRMAAESGDRCGTLEVAGRAVAAAFVGATAGALVIAEATRYIIAGPRYGVIDASLSDLSHTQAIEAPNPPPPGNPGFARLR